MPEAIAGVIGAVLGATITAVTAVYLQQTRRRDDVADRFLTRAIGEDLQIYQSLYVAVRRLENSLVTYARLDDRITDRSDQFLYQMLAIVRERIVELDRAANWQDQVDLIRVPLSIELQLDEVRALAHNWSERRRRRLDDVVSIRIGTGWQTIDEDRLARLSLGEYHELKIETKRIVQQDDDAAREVFLELASLLRSLTLELKSILAPDLPRQNSSLQARH